MGQILAANYEIIAEIGRGPAGTIYEVRHSVLGRTCRATLVAADLDPDPERLERAIREASALRDEGIVHVYGLVRDGEHYLLVEASTGGETLGDLLRRQGPLAPVDALHVARQIAKALACAHDAGVVHGALALANVRIEPGTPLRAMVAGFGVGELLWAAPQPSAELLAFSPPERLSGGNLDPRADVFALGMLLFAMLEGRAFFDGASEAEIRAALCENTAPLLPRYTRIPPGGVPSLVGRAIRRAPSQRPRTMAQMVGELDTCLRRVGELRMERARGITPGGLPVRRVVPEALELEDLPAAERTGTPASQSRWNRPRHRAQVVGVFAAGILLVLGAVAIKARGTAPAPIAPAEPAVPSAEVAVSPPLEPPAAAAPEPVGRAQEEPLTDGDAAPAAPAPEPDLPPRIESYWPREKVVSAAEGTSIGFGVRAIDPNPDDRLAYAWSLDGRRVSPAPEWRLRAPAAAAGPHVVRVRVTDRTGHVARRLEWKVEVTPRMSETNVREWLDRLAAAWERRDVATLRLYGVVRTDAEAETVRKHLARTESYRVSIGNTTIRTQGRYARVEFDRVEFDRSEKVLMSARQTCELEKRADGFVALRAP